MIIVILFLRVTAESTFSTAEEGLTRCSQVSVRQRNPEASDSLSLTHQQKGLEHKPSEPISMEFQNKDYKTTFSKREGPLGLRERAERGLCSGAADWAFPFEADLGCRSVGTSTRFGVSLHGNQGAPGESPRNHLRTQRVRKQRTCSMEPSTMQLQQGTERGSRTMRSEEAGPGALLLWDIRKPAGALGPANVFLELPDNTSEVMHSFYYYWF